MGSGTAIKLALKKYGINNFTKEILFEFSTSKEAYDKEKELVTEEFINRRDTYNMISGGSIYDDRVFNDEVRHIRSEHRKTYIKDNYDEWYKTQLKINRNPEKIQKMADKHKGMKRSIETRQNQSDAKKQFIEKHGTTSFGKGCIYIHNIETHEIRRHNSHEDIPDGWVRGTGKHKKKRKGFSEEYKAKMSESRKGKTWINNGKIQKLINKDDINNYIGFIKGRLK